MEQNHLTYLRNTCIYMQPEPADLHSFRSHQDIICQALILNIVGPTQAVNDSIQKFFLNLYQAGGDN